jgi:hypothetical protein
VPRLETEPAEPADATGATRRAGALVAAVLGETPRHDLAVALRVAEAGRAKARLARTVGFHATILDVSVAALLELGRRAVARTGRAVLAAIAHHVAAARSLHARRAVARLSIRARTTGVRCPAVVRSATLACAVGDTATGGAVAGTAGAGLATIADQITATNGQALPVHGAALTRRTRSARPSAGIRSALLSGAVRSAAPGRGARGAARTVPGTRITGLAGIADAIWARARGLARPLVADLTGFAGAAVIPARVRTAHVRAAAGGTAHSADAERPAAAAILAVVTGFTGARVAGAIATRRRRLALTRVANVSGRAIRARQPATVQAALHAVALRLATARAEASPFLALAVDVAGRASFAGLAGRVAAGWRRHAFALETELSVRARRTLNRHAATIGRGSTFGRRSATADGEAGAECAFAASAGRAVDRTSSRSSALRGVLVAVVAGDEGAARWKRKGKSQSQTRPTSRYGVTHGDSREA